jgi:predicted aldo/keto reductase-like oxidoreductase
VDLLLSHGSGSREAVMSEATMSFLQKAKAAGKTRFIGTSTHKDMAAVILALIEAKIYDAVLTTYNFKCDPSVKEAIAKAGAAGIGVIAMKTQAPIASYEKKKAANPAEAEPTLPFPTKGLTLHQAALKWVLDDPNVSFAVPGMNSFQQFEECVSVMGKRLGYLDQRRLERYAQAVGMAYCSGCIGCAGACPHGVNIADVRRSLMYLQAYGEEPLARETYRELHVNAARCADCGGCTARCANGVALRPILMEAHRRLG